MRTSEVQRELEQLRKEVAALSAARKPGEPPIAPEEDNAPSTAGPEEPEHAIKGQIEELIKVLQEEVRGMPAVTTLAVFALGILMGRHLR